MKITGMLSLREKFSAVDAFSQFHVEIFESLMDCAVIVCRTIEVVR